MKTTTNHYHLPFTNHDTIPTTIATNDYDIGNGSESSSLRRLLRDVYNNNKRDINDIAADKTVVDNSHNRLLRQVQNINEVQVLYFPIMKRAVLQTILLIIDN